MGPDGRALIAGEVTPNPARLTAPDHRQRRRDFIETERVFEAF